MAPSKRRSTSIKNIMPKKRKSGGVVIPPAVAPAPAAAPPEVHLPLEYGVGLILTCSILIQANILLDCV